MCFYSLFSETNAITHIYSAQAIKFNKSTMTIEKKKKKTQRSTNSQRKKIEILFLQCSVNWSFCHIFKLTVIVHYVYRHTEWNWVGHCSQCECEVCCSLWGLRCSLWAVEAERTNKCGLTGAKSLMRDTYPATSQSQQHVSLWQNTQLHIMTDLCYLQIN